MGGSSLVGNVACRGRADRVFAQALPRSVHLGPAEAVDLGYAALDLGLSSDQIIDALSRAEDDPDYRLEARILRGGLLYRAGLDDAAEAVMTSIFEEVGPAALPCEDLVFLLRRMASRDPRRALALIDEARTAGIRYYACDVVEAVCLARLRRIPDAIGAHSRALDTAPAELKPRIQLLGARLAMMAGDPGQALVWYRRALRPEKGSERSYYRAAHVAFACGAFHVAVKWLAKARVSTRFRTAVCLRLQARACLKIKRADKAIRLLEMALDVEPALRSTQLLFVEALLQHGQPSRVVDILEPEVAAQPDWVEARLWLARAFRALGKHQSALRHATEVAESGRHVADAELIRGNSLAEMKDLKGAVEAYRAVLKLRPNEEHARSRVEALLEKISVRGTGRRPAGGKATAGGAASISRKEQNIGEAFVVGVLSRPTPPMFVPRWTARDLAPARRWSMTLFIHFRVVWAVMLRETRTRFGRRQAGYLWALLEPAIMVSLLMLIFIVLRGRQGVFGMSTALFLTTGVIPFMFFQKTYRQVSGAVSGNKVLLGFPQVKVFDLVMARAMLEGVTNLLIFIVFLGVLSYWEGANVLPSNLLEVLSALLLLWLSGVALALIVQSLRPVVESLGSTVNAAVRLLYLSSGVIFAVAMLPPNLRPYALFNPFMHLIEIIRHNFNASLRVDGVNFGYPLVFIFALLLVGLLLDRAMREKMLER